MALVERGYGHYVGNVVHFFWVSCLDNIELRVGLMDLAIHT